MKFGDTTSGQPRKTYTKKDRVLVERNPTFPKVETSGERYFNLMKPEQWLMFCGMPEYLRKPYVESIRTEYRP